MLKALVEKHGFEVSGRWYDIAFEEDIPTLEDERQKALDAFARG